MIAVDDDFIEEADKVAAAMRRGLEYPVGAWGELLAEAQRQLGHFQDHYAESDHLLEESASIKLIAAARVISSAFDARSVGGPEDRLHLALLGAAAYGMYGNATGASTLLSHVVDDLPAAPGYATAVALLAPRLIGTVWGKLASSEVHRQFIELLNKYLRDGDPAGIASVENAFWNVVRVEEDSLLLSVFRSARVALSQLCELSLARTLMPYTADRLTSSYVQRLVDLGHVTLLPPQYRAITRSDLITSDSNALIALPTSTGKTLLAELCLVAALKRSPGLCVYVAPYVALGAQVADRLSRHVDPEVNVHRAFGSYVPQSDLAPDTRSEILVATPEGLDGLLRYSSELLDSVRTVVFDEAHLIQQGQRGVRSEGLLSRLRLVSQRRHHLRLILISAVLGDYSQLCEWLQIPADQQITDSWRPTARRLAMWRQDGRLNWLQGDDPVVPKATQPNQVVGSRRLPWPDNQLYPTEFIGEIKKQQPSVHRNVAYLADELFTKLNGPVLCACGTKSATRNIARALAARFDPLEPMPLPIRQTIAKIRATHQQLGELANMLERGVCYHNATVPKDIRTLLESAIAKGCLRAVAATTTLAEGVDLPFRSTILVDWLVWSGGRQAPMSALTFRNIAGRCGRAGTFTEGDTVIFDNPLGSLAYTAPNLRQSVQARLLLPPASLESAMVKGDVSHGDLTASIGAQLLAAIGEHPDLESVQEHFVASTYAHALGHSAKITGAVQESLKSILGQDGPPLAKAASPLRLTALGTAVNVTGFSPASARRILRFTESVSEMTVTDVGSAALIALGGLPEIHSAELANSLKPKTRFLIRPEDLAGLINMRRQQVSFAESFALLPFVMRSKRQPSVSAWLEGAPSESWDSQFDSFTQFVQTVIQQNLPWLLRACGTLSEAAEHPSAHLDWFEWADSLEVQSDLEDVSDES